MNGIQDSVALVTGASSGIGEATAKRFAAEGASVVAADVDVDGGEATVTDIEDAGGEATFVETDVTDADQVDGMVETAVETYGSLEYAFNNAGVEGTLADVPEHPMENWREVMAVNLDGVFFGMRAAIPAILESGGGAIVNTASVAGLITFPGLSPYVASKHGVIGLTKTAAVEFGTENVRVNAVCPGVIATPMIQRAQAEVPEGMEDTIMNTPMGRLGEPEEVGDAVVWLCSDDSSYVTGEHLVIDGGLTIR